jgi:hypothetical protein
VCQECERVTLASHHVFLLALDCALNGTVPCGLAGSGTGEVRGLLRASQAVPADEAVPGLGAAAAWAAAGGDTGAPPRMHSCTVDRFRPELCHPVAPVAARQKAVSLWDYSHNKGGVHAALWPRV